MAQDDVTVIGLTQVKINGIYHVDIKGGKWRVNRANPQTVTGGGVRQAVGTPLCSGSLDEVVPRSKQLNVRALKNFTIEILDAETLKVVVFSAEGCNWNNLDGSTELGGANTSRSWAWNGSVWVKG